ncbi:MAG TPA: hypothetical protein VGN13_12525 [Solirubrobacteraceae bacterium]|jgi:hypothetical protein
MIVSDVELREILSAKHRRRTLERPVTYGRFGERKRCPVKLGGVYRLTTKTPYEAYRNQAQREPTRARAVLHLIERCLESKMQLSITISETPVMVGDRWIVRFTKGDHRGVQDRPLYLSKVGDYTFDSWRQAVPGDPDVCLPLAADIEKARRETAERRIHPQVDNVRKMERGAGELARAMKRMKVENAKAESLIRRAQRNLTAAARLLSEDAVSCAVAAPELGTPGEAARPQIAGDSATPEAA